MTVKEYDQHVVFCEEYIQRVQKGLEKLIQSDPIRETMDIGSDLVGIRAKYAPWLSAEIEAKLESFETALIKIGTERRLSKDLPSEDGRNRIIKEVYRFFGLILDHEKPAREEEACMSKNEIVGQIRNILGLSILAVLRQKGPDRL